METKTEKTKRAIEKLEAAVICFMQTGEDRDFDRLEDAKKTIGDIVEEQEKEIEGLKNANKTLSKIASADLKLSETKRW